MCSLETRYQQTSGSLSAQGLRFEEEEEEGGGGVCTRG